MLETILKTVRANKKQIVVYILMTCGDPWDIEVVASWTERLHTLGVEILSLSDIIRSSIPKSISFLFSKLIPAHPHIEF